MSSSKSTWLTMVAMAEPRLPRPRTVAEAIPGTSQPELTSETPGMATFRWEEATVAYTLIPRPIPASQLSGPVATAWYWPTAAAALRDHTAHLLVTLVDESRDAIDKAIRLTAFTNALAQTAEAKGILWAPGGLIHEPQAFAEQAGQMNRDNLPLYLWIDFRIERRDDGDWRAFTTGLEAFERKELEVVQFAGQAQQLLNDMYNVAHYVVTNESAIKDADTIGLPDGRQATACHNYSLLEDQRQVIQLEFE